MNQHIKEASVDAATLYNLAVKGATASYQQGKLDLIDKLLEELDAQENDGYRNV